MIATDKKYSKFWLDDFDEFGDSWASSVYSPQEKKSRDLVRMAAARRAVANFVTILTGQQIPVIFHEGDSSFTDGKKVVISANFTEMDFDPTVGLALHEAAHIIKSDFNLVKLLDKKIPSDVYDLAAKKGFENKSQVAKFVHLMLNYVEDRFIDDYVYSEAPGYRGYYIALYNKYFHSEIVAEGLRSSKHRTETIDSYFFRMLNLTNACTNLNALKGLKKIWEVLDLKNISRLRSPNARASVAYDIARIIFSSIDDTTVPPDMGQQAEMPQPQGQPSDCEGSGMGINTTPEKAEDKKDKKKSGSGKGEKDESDEDESDKESGGSSDDSDDSDDSDGEENGKDGEGKSKEDEKDEEDSKKGSGEGEEEGEEDESEDDAAGEAGGSDESEEDSDESEEGESNESQSDEESNDNEDDDSKGGDKGGKDDESKNIDLTPDQSSELDKAIEEQKNFVNGIIEKAALSEEEKRELKDIEETGTDLVRVAKDYQSGTFGTSGIDCIVVKNMTLSLMDSPTFPFKRDIYNRVNNVESINNGIRLGTVLGRKLQVRGEVRDTKFTRKDSGKIERRLLSSLGYDYERVFSQISVSQYKKAAIHISVDASSSMIGQKWSQAMTCVVAICKAANMIHNLRVVVSFRGCSVSTGRHDSVSPYIVIAYDSAKDKFAKVQTLFSKIGPSGGTPEGLAFEAVLDLLPDSNAELESYFLNFSDGEPCFSHSYGGQSFYYSGEEAAQHTRRQIERIRKAGIKVLSYFIEEGARQRLDSAKLFKTMYGLDAQFVDVTNMMQVAQTMNNRFLSK